MNRKNHYFTGVLFITLGVLFLLVNLGIIDWSIFSALYYMWPLILVAIGVNIFFNNNVAVRIITFVTLVAALVFFGLHFNGLQKQTLFNWNVDLDLGRDFEIETFKEPLDESTRKGELHLNLGAGDVDIGSTDALLYEAKIPGEIANARVSYSQNKKKAVVNVEHDKNFFLAPQMFEKKNHQYDVLLNEDVQWNMSIEMGAVDADLDLVKLDIDRLDIETGAGDVLIKLGDLSELMDVSVQAGAGDVTIEIPENVGVVAEVDAGIHDLDLTGEGWRKDDDEYISSNYQEADAKVRLKLELGVGDVNIQHD